MNDRQAHARARVPRGDLDAARRLYAMTHRSRQPDSSFHGQEASPNPLEWRLAADSAWRNPYAPDVDEQVILMCDQAARRFSRPDVDEVPA